MAWCHIRELVWTWLDTQSKLKVVAARKDSWLQSGLDFGTAEIQYLLSFTLVRSITPTTSPLQASPMSVEDALGVPILQIFSKCV